MTDPARSTRRVDPHVGILTKIGRAVARWWDGLYWFHWLMAYCFIGLVTFGYAANHLHMVTKDGSDQSADVFMGILCALCWPFYWSYEVQR